MGQLNSQLFAGSANAAKKGLSGLTCGNGDQPALRSLNSHCSRVRVRNRGLARVKKKPIYYIHIHIYTLVDHRFCESWTPSRNLEDTNTREESEFANKVDVSAGQRPFCQAWQVRRKREERCEQRFRPELLAWIERQPCQSRLEARPSSRRKVKVKPVLVGPP